MASKGAVLITNFKLKGDYITLAQFLKDLTYISSGGQAKWFLAENTVYVNGESEQRRGKKLHSGDQVKIGQDEFMIQGLLVD